VRELVRNAISERRANSGVWSKLSRLPHQAARQVRDFDLVTAATQAALERAARLPGETTSETSMPIATGNQLLDEKARHAGLSWARIVQQQETQRLTRPHSLPDSRDLMAPAARRAMCGPRATGSNKCARRMRWGFGNKNGTGGHRNSRDGRLRRFAGAARRAGTAACARQGRSVLYMSAPTPRNRTAGR
jgi:hypothetical protein